MKNFLLLPIVISMILVSCSSAQKATEVNATRVSVAPYIKMNCQELATEMNDLVRAAEAAGAQVDSEYRSDKNAELAAWILFAPAAFWISGNQEETAKLASIKGQLEAVQEAQKINSCVR